MPRRKKQKITLFSPATFLLLVITQVVFILYMVGQLFLFIPYNVSDEYVESDAAKKFEHYDFKLVEIGSERYKLYIANDETKRTQGLSGVTSMNNFEGMAFVMDQAAQHGFWMKDMYMPLDFVYVENDVVVDIIEDVTPETFPETIIPSQPASVVIELTSDQIEKNGLQIGDALEL